LVPGVEKQEIDTPALILDLKLLEHNIKVMSDFISGVKAELRPHVKAHRTPMIAHKQVEAGAKGITCAKVSEAEVMLESGLKDIFIANQVVGEKKIARLIRLAKKGRISVAVDSIENARSISRLASEEGMKVDVLIEVDIGTHRCGLRPGKPVLEFAKEILRLEGIRLRGLMGYEGFASSIIDFEERKRACIGALQSIIETRDLLEDAGIDVEVLSLGSTGTYRISGSYPGVTEIRPGSYVLSSVKHKRIVPEFEIAFTLLSTVISRPSEDRAVIDAGRNAISYDQGLPLVKGMEGVELVKLYDEHGVLKIRNKEVKLEVGDKIELIPTHPCTTVALHEKMFCIDKGMLEDIWDIATRGRFF
jgi:D-serine deaminase-like pyridoxal phosphate-dependent protein